MLSHLKNNLICVFLIFWWERKSMKYAGEGKFDGAIECRAHARVHKARIVSI